MAWQEDVMFNIRIVTGDGRHWEPLMKNPKFDLNFNAVPVQYNDIRGADVKRGEVAYKIYRMTIYFQGDNNLKDMRDFMKSSENRSRWTIFHPYYGEIKCHPDKVAVNNSSDNVSIVSLTVYETIDFEKREADERSRKSDAEEGINSTSNDLINNGAENTYGRQNSQTSKTATDNISQAYDIASATDQDKLNIVEAINKFQTKLNTIGTKPVEYFELLAYLFRTPTRYMNTITNRMEVIKGAYINFKLAYNGATEKDYKQYFENAAGILVLALAEASIIPQSEIAKEQDIEFDGVEKEYETRSGVLKLIESINETYNDYVDTLNTFYSEKDNQAGSYYPSYKTINSLNKSIKLITSTLFSIAAGAKQERNQYIANDKSLLVAVNEFYGKVDKNTIMSFVANNKLSGKELLLIKGGKTLKYYV